MESQRGSFPHHLNEDLFLDLREVWLGQVRLPLPVSLNGALNNLRVFRERGKSGPMVELGHHEGGDQVIESALSGDR